MEGQITSVLKLQDGPKLVSELDLLVAHHGKDAVDAFTDSSKHKNCLLHLLAIKGHAEALKHMVTKHGFDLNRQRASDKCTPAHVCAWSKNQKKEEMMRTILALKPDLTLKNKYGETSEKLLELVEKLQNLIWLDLELTSLEAPQVMEAAVIITTGDLKEVARKEWVLSFSKDELAKLSSWHQQTFSAPSAGGNGLMAACLASRTTKEEFEREFLDFLKPHSVKAGNFLAGSSVHCDREALRFCHPELYKYFSHRVIDVSTLLGALERWSPQQFGDFHVDTKVGLEPLPSARKKPRTGAGAAVSTAPESSASLPHRAMWDIERSLCTAAWFKQHMFSANT